MAFLVDSEAQPQNCFDMYEAVICNRFTENAYMPCVAVYCLWLSLLVNNAQLEICLDIYEAQEMLTLERLEEAVLVRG